MKTTFSADIMFTGGEAREEKSCRELVFFMIYLVSSTKRGLKQTRLIYSLFGVYHADI